MLQEDLVSDVSTDSHYTTLSGFNDAVNASYAPLRGVWGNNVGAYLEAYGTDINMNAGHGGYHHYNQYEGGLNPDDGLLSSIWSNYYEAINTVNAAINRAEDIQVPESQQLLKDTRLGEVHALRAFYYFTLVQQFGAVTLTTEETSGIETQAERTEPSAVYEQIVSDLETALDYLEGQGPNGQHVEFGRVNEAVAKMMLSHVLLTRGYHDFGASNDFERAASLAESVINDYNYSLVEDYERIFAQDNQQNSEIIWSVQYGTSALLNGGEDDGNHSHVYYRPWYETYAGPQGNGAGLSRSMEYGRPWIRFKMTPFALENFRPIDQDARYEKSFQELWRYNDAASLPSGAAVGDTAIYIDPNLTAAEVDAQQPSKNYYLMSWETVHRSANINMFPSLKKHDDFERSSVNDYGGTKDYFVYRLAEAYLFAAEAHHQLGNNQQAADHINVVRRRAAWPGQESNMEISAGDVTLDFILNERAREFYGEDKRWTTLKRTGKLIERVQQYGGLQETRSNVSISAPAKYGNLGYKFLLRPIPTNQITRTEGGYEQNPGY
ncbi:MAG: RagB/SusD family nutrient uptake outer membrane protein [Balneolaceae bacterium]|nr:RagB/SusD family nutrient uptake outer membrane protein [Balneolaceae bacterium]